MLLSTVKNLSSSNNSTVFLVSLQLSLRQPIAWQSLLPLKSVAVFKKVQSSKITLKIFQKVVATRLILIEILYPLHQTADVQGLGFRANAHISNHFLTSNSPVHFYVIISFLYLFEYIYRHNGLLLKVSLWSTVGRQMTKILTVSLKRHHLLRPSLYVRENETLYWNLLTFLGLVPYFYPKEALRSVFEQLANFSFNSFFR